VEVRSRIVGQPESMDRSPAVLEVLIDKTPPEVALGKDVKDGSLAIEVSDVVSPAHAITVRWGLDDEPLGKPILAAALASIDVGAAETLKIEATDEEGNVASVSHSLIRGKQDKSLAGESACNCSVPGSGDRNAGRWGLGALALLGLGLLSRRRRSAAPRPFVLDARRARYLVAIPLMAIGLSWSGCSCGDDSEGSESGDGGNDAKPPGACPEGDTCSQILPGLVGAYASAAVDSDGAIWVAAYDDIGYEVDPDGVETQYLFGDLVVGKWNGTKVDWQVVDGLPAELPEVDPFLYDITGFRFGVTDAGDDVGLWTSIAIEGGSPRVAYFDAKNRALKYAEHSAGSWRTHTVEQITDGDAGRYAKLLFVGGNPVIAYMAIRPGTGGFSESAVRVATANNASPASASDWTIVDAVVDPQTPCNGYTCGAEECRSDTLTCQATTSGCDPNCSSGEKCFDEGGTPTCVATVTPSSLVAYPDGIGLYIALESTPTGLGIAYYDRNHGNLMAVREDSGTWQPPVIVDGQGTGPNGPIDTGDVGIGTSLFVDPAGDWHIAYANGFDESLRYIKVTGGITPGASEVVDDGVTTDGNAVVGDDTSIHVTGTGEVQIAYQNATHGEARWATGAPNGATHTWTKTTLTVSDFAGGFNQILEVGDQTQVLTWWRRGVPRTEGDIAIVTP
jgi:MYXO-CTERM domain-containing protein